jgi:hypothetical protein
MRKVLQLISVAVLSMGLGLAIGGCGSSTTTGKDKMGGSKMDDGKMKDGKMDGVKMDGHKMDDSKKDKM